MEQILLKTGLMPAMIQPMSLLSRNLLSRVSLVAILGLFPLGLGLWTVAAQAPRPGQVPYLGISPNGGQSPPATTAPVQGAPTPQPTADALRQRDQDLDVLRVEQKKAQENEVRLRREIESIGSDRQKLNQQLIDTAARVRGVEEQVSKTEERLIPLDLQAQVLRQSLEARRSVIAEVLAALQRMGRHPAPALMVSPEDALQSVHSAIMLGAVLPKMREEAQNLVKDLSAQLRLRQEIEDTRASLSRDLVAIALDRQRLSLLIEQRQSQQADTEKSLAAEHQRAAQLARQADDLKDLVGKLGPGREKSAPASPPDRRPGSGTLASLQDPGRLGPAIAFGAAKGSLPMPVNGVRIKDFGISDGVGGTEKGLSIAARPGAQVTAPCDGWVVYSGAFRNYGQLLILNAGGGYHVLLAGMDRISVDLGQFVVTGEPVAVMGGGGQATGTLAIGSGRPVLYVEFRKDGTPVDPGPWWAASEGEKVRG
jgi:septal ring factor EnvC (AmiA/AmiB activator)